MPESVTTREKLADEIHYPRCWDTAAYATLEDALYEILVYECSECMNTQQIACFDVKLTAEDCKRLLTKR